MSVYENLIMKSDLCTYKALHTNDMYLKKFYANAGLGYKIKAEKLTIEEGMKKYGDYDRPRR